MTDPERYLRQIILAGVGDEGQRRLASATASVGGIGLAHEIASAYCERAGFAGIDDGPIDIERLAPIELVAETPAREVLAGSRAGLAEMRRALGVGRGAV